MKNLTIGILAHVDAGKTTLSEAMLYVTGGIRKLGRVDKKDAFLDTYALERARGITIFSKQAVFSYEDVHITLLDTPGHVDFSAEMERTLQVLDYAVLVINGTDGVQGHTRTLWRLLQRYGIPVFLFINKMDQPGTDRQALLIKLQRLLSESCVDFGRPSSASFLESIAVAEEGVLEHFLEYGTIQEEDIGRLIRERKLFPCFFGSALKVEGVKELLEGIRRYTCQPVYPPEFGARVFKIARDEQGNRLTYMKITGGSLPVKAVLPVSGGKVNQIRIYSGEKYQTVNEVCAGTVCAVTGLGVEKPGEGLGFESASPLPVLEPVLTYRIVLPDGVEEAVALPKLRQLEEEEPELHIVWQESLREIHAQIMGEVQTEILKSLVKERFDMDIAFDEGSIVYKETIAGCVEGVGHFEPLRHYAEVHLLLEPAERGSGVCFQTRCSEDVLEGNWQRLILTHLAEKEHRGVLTGAPITDITITLTTGRAHKKHTEGGDFRQATYRAVRQGLMQAEMVLLEPYYDFRLEIPGDTIGRALADIERMGGKAEPPDMDMDNETAVLTGYAPVASMRGYQKELVSYTKGRGRLSCTLRGYEPCHDTQEVTAQIGYDPERDMDNPSGSVFCSHGAGFPVDWEHVKDYMHMEATLTRTGEAAGLSASRVSVAAREEALGTEEIDAILERTFYANSRKKEDSRRGYTLSRETIFTPSQTIPASHVHPVSAADYLLVDGYNIIFAWEELKELATVSIDGARGKLQDILCNYQAITRCRLILVFDAYRVQNHAEEAFDYHNIRVVFTAEAETADRYIEKFAHVNAGKFRVTVATSDYLEQIITRGQGCSLLSARELEEEVKRAAQAVYQKYVDGNADRKIMFRDAISERAAGELGGIEDED